jgi:arsenate reductase
MSDRIKVLFLCTGNSCRSQMAEGLLREMTDDRVEVVSAGTEPAERVHPLAVETMADRGIDISAQYPKLVDQFLEEDIDYVITTCAGAAESCPAFLGAKQTLHWPLPDPARAEGTPEEIKAVFGETADELDRRLREQFADYLKK